jgi:uncharacterized glyoxalase superfamily protein PhnB
MDDVVLMVATDDAGPRIPPLVGLSTGFGLYLQVADGDVDVLHDRAIAVGGRSVVAPEATGVGTRHARVLDPQGGMWTFGSYAPGGGW